MGGPAPENMTNYTQNSFGDMRGSITLGMGVMSWYRGLEDIESIYCRSIAVWRTKLSVGGYEWYW